MRSAMAEELQLLIEKMVYGGDGLSHADGNTVFVPYVLPEEQVKAATVSRKKKLVWAKPLEITKANTERVEPFCPHFGTCGGCHYQHASYAAQVQWKVDILRETLSRMGGVLWAGDIKTHTAAPQHYRNRAQWAVRHANPRALGYFRPESNIALNVAFKQFAAPVAQLTKLFRDALPSTESLLLLDQKTNRFELSGPGYLIQQAGGYDFRVSHLSFFQVNRFLIEDLWKAVISGAKGE